MSPKGRPYEDIWTPPPSLAPSLYLTISANKSFLRGIYRDRARDEEEREMGAGKHE